MISQNTGLLPTKPSYKDFSHEKLFGNISPLQLPEEYFIKPIAIKDQGNTTMCVSFATSSTSEDEEGIELSPEFQAAKVHQLIGTTYDAPVDLRTGCDALCKKGSLPASLSPYSWQKNGADFVCNPANWDPKLDEKAFEHRKMSYFRVDGPNDQFDNLRSALYMNRAEKRTIFLGTRWYNEFNLNQKGIVSPIFTNFVTYHAYKICGWKTINGTSYLIAQLSQGTNFGDNGFLYFSREVINRLLADPFSAAYTFKDMDPDNVRQQITLIEKILGLFSQLIQNIILNPQYRKLLTS